MWVTNIDFKWIIIEVLVVKIIMSVRIDAGWSNVGSFYAACRWRVDCMVYWLELTCRWCGELVGTDV
jgi:hypothetical protein